MDLLTIRIDLYRIAGFSSGTLIISESRVSDTPTAAFKYDSAGDTLTEMPDIPRDVTDSLLAVAKKAYSIALGDEDEYLGRFGLRRRD